MAAPVQHSPVAEWLETTGAGAFASGTVSGVRTRRYHALLMHAASPSSGRVVLVAGYDAWVDVGPERLALTQQRYQGDIVAPPVAAQLAAFAHQPWPRWTFDLAGAGRVECELFIAAETGESIIRWDVRGLPAGAVLGLRPFLACRDYHALQRRDDSFVMEPERRTGALMWRPYPERPGIRIRTNGAYAHEPHWYERFEYAEEQRRGFDHLEDLASPGVLTWPVSAGAAPPVLILAALSSGATSAVDGPGNLTGYAVRLTQAEAAARSALDPAVFAAGQYVVRRGNGKTIIAGYPWFTDWGRDTFIALRGLCLATGRLEDAQDILSTWAGTVENGLLPNRFPDDAGAPDYGAADAALWFIIAGFEYLARARAAGRRQRPFDRMLRDVACDILQRYLRGAPYGIRMAEDGLLAAGEPGRALTWMDAKVDGVPVTGRMGKPVELQCLWINALECVRRRASEFNAAVKSARRAFLERFWSAERGYLADVVDADHVAGRDDVSLRPNQIFAVGGLPRAVVPRRIGRAVVRAVDRALWTPLGLRTLPPDDPAYRGRYAGGPETRDSAYHQGTVWPWLIGAFGEAWLRVHGATPRARAEVRDRFLGPLEAHLGEAGLGHMSELADGDAPHEPDGCPFQAWSLGEYLRLRALCTPDGSATD